MLVTQLGLTLCGSMDCSLLGSCVHGDSPGKNTGVAFHALLQGPFPIQGSNPGLPHCRQILYCLSHQGSPTVVGLDNSFNRFDKRLHKEWEFLGSCLIIKSVMVRCRLPAM